MAELGSPPAGETPDRRRSVVYLESAPLGAFEEPSGPNVVLDQRNQAFVPYVLAIIELDEGVRMHSNVVGIDPKEVEIGMRVEVVWDEVTPEFSLPKFRPIQK